MTTKKNFGEKMFMNILTLGMILYLRHRPRGVLGGCQSEYLFEV